MNTKKAKLDTYTGFYRGKVLDNTDSSQLGRIKVNIHGVFDGISSQYLPWAVPAMPLFSGSGTDQGCFCVPDVGTYVWCFFEGAHLYQPVYFAEASDGVHGKISERTTNYPNRRILKTKNDIVIYIDDTDKEIKVDHPSGAYVTIDGSGNIEIKGTTVHINPT